VGHEAWLVVWITWAPKQLEKRDESPKIAKNRLPEAARAALHGKIPQCVL